MDSAPGCCWHCGLRGMKLCTRCGFAIYCSVQCEVDDRQRHQDECTDSALSVSCCSFCGKARTYNQRCPLCYTVAYCSSSCREMDIRNHKPACNASKLKVMEMSVYLCNQRRPVRGVPQYSGCLIHAVDLLQYRRNEGQREKTVNAPYMMHGMLSDRRPACLDTPLRVLLLGADLKHVFRTITGSCKRLQKQVEFHLVDPSLHRLARSVFFLYALTRNDKDLKNQSINTSEAIVQLMYSLHLDENSFTFMCDILDDLVNLSYGKILGDSEVISLFPNVVYSLKEIWKGWLQFIKDPNAMQKMDIVRKAKLGCLPILEVFQKYIVSLPDELKESAQYWILRGDLRPPWEDTTYVTFPNVTLSCFNPFHVKNVKRYSDISPRWGQDVPWIPRMILEDSMVYAAHGVDLMFQDWDYMDVSKDVCHRTDMLSMYRNYLEETIQCVKEILAQGNIMIFLSASEPNVLPQDLNVKYDRIATGIYSDLYSFPFLLKTFQKFLNSNNPSACILTHHRLWSVFLNGHNSQRSAELNKRESFHEFSPPMCFKSDRDIQSKWATFRSFLQAEVLLSQNKDMNLLNDEDIPIFSDAQHFSGLVMRDFSKELNHVIPFRFRSETRSATMPDSCLYTLEWTFPKQKAISSSNPLTKDSVANFAHSDNENYLVNYSFPSSPQETRDSGDECTRDDNKMYVVNCSFSPTSLKTKDSSDKDALDESENSEVDYCFSAPTPETENLTDKCKQEDNQNYIVQCSIFPATPEIKDSTEEHTQSDNKNSEVDYCFSLSTPETKDSVDKCSHDDNKKYVVQCSFFPTTPKTKTSTDKHAHGDNENPKVDYCFSLPTPETKDSVDKCINEDNKKYVVQCTFFPTTPRTRGFSDKCAPGDSENSEVDFYSSPLSPETIEECSENKSASEIITAAKRQTDNGLEDMKKQSPMASPIKHTFDNSASYEKTVFTFDVSKDNILDSSEDPNERCVLSEMPLSYKHVLDNSKENMEDWSILDTSSKTHTFGNNVEYENMHIPDTSSEKYSTNKSPECEDYTVSPQNISPEKKTVHNEVEYAKYLLQSATPERQKIQNFHHSNALSFQTTENGDSTNYRKKSMQNLDDPTTSPEVYTPELLQEYFQQESVKSLCAFFNSKHKMETASKDIQSKEQNLASNTFHTDRFPRKKQKSRDSKKENQSKHMKKKIKSLNTLKSEEEPEFKVSVNENLTQKNSTGLDSTTENIEWQGTEIQDSSSENLPRQSPEDFVSLTNSTPQEPELTVSANENVTEEKSRGLASFTEEIEWQGPRIQDSCSESMPRQRPEDLVSLTNSTSLKGLNAVEATNENLPRKKQSNHREQRREDVPIQKSEVFIFCSENTPRHKTQDLDSSATCSMKQRRKSLEMASESSLMQTSKDLKLFTDHVPYQMSKTLDLPVENIADQQLKAMDSPEPRTKDLKSFTDSPNQGTKSLDSLAEPTKHETHTVNLVTEIKINPNQTTTILDPAPSPTSHKSTRAVHLSTRKLPKISASYYIDKLDVRKSSKPVKFLRSIFSLKKSQKNKDEEMCEQTTATSNSDEPSQHLKRSTSFSSFLEGKKVSAISPGHVQSLVEQYNSKSTPSSPTQQRLYKSSSLPRYLDRAEPSLATLLHDQVSGLQSRDITQQIHPGTPTGSGPTTPVTPIYGKRYSMPFVPLSGSEYTSPTRKESVSSEDESAIFFSTTKLHNRTNGPTTWRDKERVHVKSKSPYVRVAGSTTSQERVRPRSIHMTGPGTRGPEDWCPRDAVSVSEATITLSPPGRLPPPKHRPVPSQDRLMPSPGRLMPSQDRPMPSQDRSMPSPDRYMPSQDRPMPSQDRIMPSSGMSMPSQDRPMPSSGRSMPSQDRLMQSQDRLMQSDSDMPSQDKPMPSQDMFMPSQNKDVPSSDRSMPSQDRCMQPQERIMQSQDRFLPSQDRPVPSQDNIFMPSQNKDMPSQDRLISSPDIIMQSQDRSMPSQDRLMQSDSIMPSQDRIMQSQDRHVPSQDRPVPSQDRPIPSQDRIMESQDRIMPSQDQTTPSPDRHITSPDTPMLSTEGPMPPPSPNTATPSQDTAKPLPDTPVPSQSRSSRPSLSPCSVKVTEL